MLPLRVSGPGNNGNEGVLRILQSSNITGTLPSDCLMSYPGHLLGGGGLNPLQRSSQCILQPQADWATPGQSGFGSNGNEKVLHTFQSSRIGALRSVVVKCHTQDTTLLKVGSNSPLQGYRQCILSFVNKAVEY